MIKGLSGILAHAWEHDCDDRGIPMGRPVYEPSKRHRLTWSAVAIGYSAEGYADRSTTACSQRAAIRAEFDAMGAEGLLVASRHGAGLPT
jgi:hypothetical protein